MGDASLYLAVRLHCNARLFVGLALGLGLRFESGLFLGCLACQLFSFTLRLGLSFEPGLFLSFALDRKSVV